jgi:hypothetical protein
VTKHARHLNILLKPPGSHQTWGAAAILMYSTVMERQAHMDRSFVASGRQTRHKEPERTRNKETARWNKERVTEHTCSSPSILPDHPARHQTSTAAVPPCTALMQYSQHNATSMPGVAARQAWTTCTTTGSGSLTNLHRQIGTACSTTANSSDWQQRHCQLPPTVKCRSSQPHPTPPHQEPPCN